MDKPSWDDAPTWAEFLAQDPGGEWWWYEDRPFWCFVKDRWAASSGNAICHSDLQDKYEGYKSTLERRP